MPRVAPAVSVGVACVALFAGLTGCGGSSHSGARKSTGASGGGLAQCSPGQLTGQLSPLLLSDPGQDLGGILFTNFATRPCRLSGQPTLTLLDGAGRRLKLVESVYTHAPNLPPPATPVILGVSGNTPDAMVELDFCGFHTIASSPVDVRFTVWAKPLQVASGDGSVISPPACSNGSKTMLGVDYIRRLTANGIAGSTPRVSVTPASNLHDGQEVQVRVSGFDIEGKFSVSECAIAAQASDLGCGQQLALQAFSLTDVSGQGYMTFEIHSRAFQAFAGAEGGSSARTCTYQCVIVATLGDSYAFAYAPITFADATRP